MLEKVFDNNFDVKNVCKHKMQNFKKKTFSTAKKQVQILTKTQAKKYQLCQQKEAINRMVLIMRFANSKLQKHYR